MSQVAFFNMKTVEITKKLKSNYSNDTTNPFVTQRWFPPETSLNYNHSEICPSGCPALVSLSASHPPSLF